MIFVGVDWAEDHHDVDVRNEQGGQLAAKRVNHGVEGLASLHGLIGEFAESPDEVFVGIETDRGLLVSSLVAAGYQVIAVNPRAVDRYRDRHSLSGAKSDAADAMVLAEMIRTDRHHHRRVAGDSEEVGGLKMVARAHQNLIWARTRHVLQLRNVLLEYYPAIVAAAEGKVGSRDALRCWPQLRSQPTGLASPRHVWSRSFVVLAGSVTWTGLPAGSSRSFEPSTSKHRRRSLRRVLRRPEHSST